MKKLYLITTLYLFCTVFLYPIDFIKSSEFPKAIKEEIEPFIQKKKQKGFFKGQNKQKIYYEKYETGEIKKAIVISHGFTEYTEKYNELIYYFIKEGYNVYILEHRGHGRSGRLGIDNMQVEVENYTYYLEDLKTFIDLTIPKDTKSLYLYAHSMGGAIGALFLEKYPDYFDKAVLSSPMLSINFGKVPNFAAKLFLNFSFGNKLRKYAPGTGAYLDPYNFEKSSSASIERYEYYFYFLASTKDVQLGGPSVNWLKECYKMTKEIIKKNNIKKVKIPVLIFQSDIDFFVTPKGQKKFAKYSKNTRLIFIPDSKHELYRERDYIMKPYLESIFDFFEE
jgi:lysophospholipase